MTDKDTKTITAYKGFDKNLSCREFQYEIGKTYEHEGDVEACSSGFHACEHPINVFAYYPPATSRYAIVEMDGARISRDKYETKIASAQITIKAELHLHELIQSAIKWVFDRAKPNNKSENSDERGAASATGDQGAASATGYQGAASATGHQGAASATGYYGAASATGYYGAASATGYQGAASATGHYGAASATGYKGKVSGATGNALFLVERNDDYEIINVWAGIVGRDDIKPDTFYTLKNGKPEEAAP